MPALGVSTLKYFGSWFLLVTCPPVYVYSELGCRVSGACGYSYLAYVGHVLLV